MPNERQCLHRAQPVQDSATGLGQNASPACVRAREWRRYRFTSTLATSINGSRGAARSKRLASYRFNKASAGSRPGSGSTHFATTLASMTSAGTGLSSCALFPDQRNAARHRWQTFAEAVERAPAGAHRLAIAGQRRFAGGLKPPARHLRTGRARTAPGLRRVRLRPDTAPADLIHWRWLPRCRRARCHPAWSQSGR